MTDYTKTVDFAVKDGYLSGDPAKIVKGKELNTEFNNIETAISTKADKLDPTFSGTITLASGAELTGGLIDGGTY